MQSKAQRSIIALLAIVLSTTVPPGRATAQEVKVAQRQGAAVGERPERAQAESQPRSDSASRGDQRSQALRSIMSKLQIGEGATIADIGAGDGRDSWVFAAVVGDSGKVYAEEIVPDKVKSLRKRAEDKQLAQVRPVLGDNDDPGLPLASVDMAFMRQVYHHFSQPREMLTGLWRALKPGGYLVIVDRRLGTLQDWVPREVRAEKHHWTAETTVVREARETGFAYSTNLDSCWPVDDQFILVFQRPRDLPQPGTDPDQPCSLNLAQLQRGLMSVQSTFQRPAFIALGQAREAIGPLLEHSTGPGLEIVLEEWATQKDERPELPEGVSLPSVLTEKGNVSLGQEPIDAVFFLDTYHLLFHGPTLLADLHERLTGTGHVFVLDRRAEAGLSRRESSHRRKIPAELVKQEMAAAGFQLVTELPTPAPDRMLLVFRKAGR